MDIFESESHFGGHSHTINISYQEKKQIAVDVGFIVFNEKTYPNLIKFFEENKIQVEHDLDIDHSYGNIKVYDRVLN